MRNSNIAKLDSKGRVLIPNHIRKELGAENGTDIVIIPETGKAQARIFPLVPEKTLKFKFVMTDIPGALAAVAETLATYNINIIMSESRVLARGKLAEWDVIADTSECNGNIDNLQEILLKSKAIKKVEVLK